MNVVPLTLPSSHDCTVLLKDLLRLWLEMI